LCHLRAVGPDSMGMESHTRPLHRFRRDSILPSMRGRSYALAALGLLGIGLALGAATPTELPVAAPPLPAVNVPVCIDADVFGALTTPLATLPASTPDSGPRRVATLQTPDYREVLASDLEPAVAPLKTEAEAPPTLPLAEQLAALVNCFRINTAK